MTTSETDQTLAHEVSRMARGAWHDPHLGEWFRGWIATRPDIADSTRRVTERWQHSGKHAVRVIAAVRAWAACAGVQLAPTGRIPTWARDGWVAATGSAPVPERPLRRNAGQTAATRAYRLPHAGMAQAVADELIPANPCAIKGAGQRDARDRVDRRTVSLQEM